MILYLCQVNIEGFGNLRCAHFVQKTRKLSDLSGRQIRQLICLRPTKLYVSAGKTPKKYTCGDAAFAVRRLDKLEVIFPLPIKSFILV